MDHVSRYEFQKCVARYDGEYKTSRFSCWDHFLCLAFAQLTYRESLRDIEACLRAVQPKLYHVGMRENAVKTQIWSALAVYVLVAIVKKRLAPDVSLYKLLQILSITLFEKMPISTVLFDVASQFDAIEDANQLPLFDL